MEHLIFFFNFILFFSEICGEACLVGVQTLDIQFGRTINPASIPVLNSQHCFDPFFASHNC